MAAYLGFTLGTEDLGAFTHAFSVVVAGTTRTTGFDLDEFTITYTLGRPSTLRAVVVGFTPSPGQEIVVCDGGIGGRRLFGGHIVAVTLAPTRVQGDRRAYVIDCQDYSWLLDRYARVTAVYEDIGYNTCANRIIKSFTDGGFRPGSVASSLGRVTRIEFTQETVRNALERLADAAEAYLHISPTKHIHIFQAPTHLAANVVALQDADPSFSRLSRTLDYTDIATRIEVRGGGSLTTADVIAGATTIPVAECRWYAGTGGRVLIEQQEVTYTGVSAASGPGTLTGCAGITRAIPSGVTVDVFVRVNDSSAQTALAAVLGGGASGVSVEYVADARLTVGEATGRANKLLSHRKAGSDVLSYTAYDEVTDAAAYAVPGKLAYVDLTHPQAIAGAYYRVQRVTITPRTVMAGAQIGVARAVTLGAEVRDRMLLDTLTRSAWQRP